MSEQVNARSQNRKQCKYQRSKQALMVGRGVGLGRVDCHITNQRCVWVDVGVPCFGPCVAGQSMGGWPWARPFFYYNIPYYCTVHSSRIPRCSAFLPTLFLACLSRILGAPLVCLPALQPSPITALCPCMLRAAIATVILYSRAVVRVSRELASTTPLHF